MDLNEHDLSKKGEVEFFPLKPEEELAALKEIIHDREIDIVPVGNAGYMVTRRTSHIIAEAPWTLVDFDDTAANTTHDKKQRCWPKIEKMGLSADIVSFCDEISRVDFGEAGFLYEPELEMRLITTAVEMIKQGKDDEAIKLSLTEIRKAIVLQNKIGEHTVSEDIQRVYDETRYTPTLYPDVEETLDRLRGNDHRPLNVALLTYGDPEFQLRKTVAMMDTNTALSTIFLTRVKKGDFFKRLLNDNPFRNMPLTFTYDETERGVGIDFRGWHIMVTLFDDDPKQVESFNQCAQDLGIVGLGVVRVRRQEAKRSDLDVEIPRGSAEVQTSDSYLDAQIFEHTLSLLEAIQLENYLLSLLETYPSQLVIDHPDIPGLIQAIAHRRGQTFKEAKDYLYTLAGVEAAG